MDWHPPLNHVCKVLTAQCLKFFLLDKYIINSNVNSPTNLILMLQI